MNLLDGTHSIPMLFLHPLKHELDDALPELAEQSTCTLAICLGCQLLRLSAGLFAPSVLYLLAPPLLALQIPSSKNHLASVGCWLLLDWLFFRPHGS